MRGLIDNSVNIGGDQVITGVKTFPNSPIVNTTGNQTIAGIKTFSSRVMAAAATNNGSAITTTALSKVQNGYVKLGNGIIIQWGYNSGFGTDAVVTLPTPFSNANYSVVPTMLSGTKYGFPTYIKAHTATNFTGERNDSNKPPMLWVAIGY